MENLIGGIRLRLNEWRHEIALENNFDEVLARDRLIKEFNNYNFNVDNFEILFDDNINENEIFINPPELIRPELIDEILRRARLKYFKQFAFK
ncbi:MAG: hypothetical protein M1419_10345 [Bacteroidetes bacterium]|nr:hypothetical protein [Bacteroidota bacterium]